MGWIGFLKVLQQLINVQRSTIEPSVYLVNPESNDLRNFAPLRKTKVPEPSQEPFKLPDVAKFSILLNGRFYQQ